MWIPKKGILRRLLIIKRTKWSTLRMSVNHFHQPTQCLHNRLMNDVSWWQWCMRSTAQSSFSFTWPGYHYWWVSNLLTVNAIEPLIWHCSQGYQPATWWVIDYTDSSSLRETTYPAGGSVFPATMLLLAPHPCAHWRPWPPSECSIEYCCWSGVYIIAEKVPRECVTTSNYLGKQT